MKPTSSSKIPFQVNHNNRECTFLIIGGGIAGVSCAEAISFLVPHEKIIIVSESSLIKSVTNLVQLGKYIQQFDFKEVAAENFLKQNVEILIDQLKSIESKTKTIRTANGIVVIYKQLCICTGARPKTIQSDCDEFIIGIRDTESVEESVESVEEEAT